MFGAPGAIRFEIFALTAVGVIDSTVQHQLLRAPLDAVQRNLRKHGNGVVIKLLETNRIELTEQAC